MYLLRIPYPLIASIIVALPTHGLPLQQYGLKHDAVGWPCETKNPLPWTPCQPVAAVKRLGFIRHLRRTSHIVDFTEEERASFKSLSPPDLNVLRDFVIDSLPDTIPSDAGLSSMHRRATNFVPPSLRKIGPSALSKIQTLARRAYSSMSRSIFATKNKGERARSGEGAAVVRVITTERKSPTTSPARWQSVGQQGVLRYGYLHDASTELAGVVGPNVAESLLTKIYHRVTLLWTEKGRGSSIMKWSGKVVGRVGQTRIPIPIKTAPGSNGQPGSNLVKTQIQGPSTGSTSPETEGSVERDSEYLAEEPESQFSDPCIGETTGHLAATSAGAGSANDYGKSTFRLSFSTNHPEHRSLLSVGSRGFLNWKLHHLDSIAQRRERRLLLEEVARLSRLDIHGEALEAVLDTPLLPFEKAYLYRIAIDSRFDTEADEANQVERSSIAQAVGQLRAVMSQVY